MTNETKTNEQKQANSLKIGIYTIYDCVLKQFESPFSCIISHLDDYMRLMVNDVQSRFFAKEKDFILNKIGEFNQETGEIEIHFIERLTVLDKYINRKQRHYQVALQTLNYLPTGYFKMSEDTKKGIQEKIDNAIKYYVENIVIPDMDVNDIKILKEKQEK